MEGLWSKLVLRWIILCFLLGYWVMFLRCFVDMTLFMGGASLQFYLRQFFISIYFFSFNPIQDGPFRGYSRMGVAITHGWGWQKGTTSLNPVTHILQWWNSFNCFWVFHDFLIIVIILMMSIKLATQGRLEIKIFWNNDYDVIIPDYGVANKILLPHSNYIVDVVMWPKFSKSSIFLMEVIITSIS